MEKQTIELYSYKASDKEDFLSLISDPKVMSFVDGVIPNDFANKLFISFIEQTTEDDVWAVRLRETGRYVGHAALIRTDRDSVREILFYIHRKYWGQGLATQIGKLIIKFAKRRYQEIEATLDEEHIASQKVCEKIGLKFREKGEDKKGTFLVYRLNLNHSHKTLL